MRLRDLRVGFGAAVRRSRPDDLGRLTVSFQAVLMAYVAPCAALPRGGAAFLHELILLLN